MADKQDNSTSKESKSTSKKNTAPAGKARYWQAVMYPESMIEDWQLLISDKLQYAGAYCIHDKDVDENGDARKSHVHIILAFNNTTTYKHALSVFKELGSCNTCERVLNIRRAYDYLIHNTESSKKLGKYQYANNERVTFNNFDIGAFEQLSLNDKLSIKKELSSLIRTQHFFNFDDFDAYVIENLSLEHYQVMCENQGYFNNLVRGHYNKIRGLASGEYEALKKTLEHLDKEGK